MAELAGTELLSTQARSSEELASDSGVDVVAIAGLFKALADPVRVQLVSLIRQSASGEACFCDLAGELDMPQPSLSYHLGVLVRADVLSRERRGTWSWYRVQEKPLETLELVLRPGGPLRDFESSRVTGGCDCC